MNNRVQFFFKIGLISALIAGFGIYGLYNARGFWEGPEITIESPKNGQVFHNSYITVKGKAKNIASILLDGRVIFVDENGNFSENLLLAKGYNIMEAKAVDKFGKEVKARREVVLK